MNTELIAQTWQALGGRQAQFVEDFYRRFFERFPGYRKLFPRALRPAHLEKMILTVTLLADLAEDRTGIAPHLRKLGAAHKPFDLKPREFDNFKEVFIEMLAPRVGAQWTTAAEKAWHDAFDEVLIPLMREGMSPGRRRA
jgi:hemoglobin-like flavoprotein